MSAEYVSLGALAQRLDVYERLPIPLQEGMKQSVVLTLKTNLFCIPTLFLTPILRPLLLNGFFSVINPTADAAHALYYAIMALRSELLVFNVISLILVGMVYFLSEGMSAPVHEPVHWAAWVAAFPSAASAVSLAIFAMLLALLFLATLVVWIVLIIISIVVCIAVFGALLGAGASR